MIEPPSLFEPVVVHRADPDVALFLTIPGAPTPQGSMIPRTGITTGGARYTRAVHPKKVTDARNVAILALADAWAGRDPITGPVIVRAQCCFPRIAGHYKAATRTRAAMSELRPDAPLWHTVPPDADKVARLLGDALEQSGVLRSDALICAWHIEKVYAATPAVHLSVRPAPTDHPSPTGRTTPE